MLAKEYDESVNPTGWWMSEKLDGIRAYWDGKRLFSRQGKQLPVPSTFALGMPDIPLDGELW
jgi:DNA ligase-1